MRVSGPFNLFYETVLLTSPICMTTTHSKFGRIWTTIEPLQDDLCKAMKDGIIYSSQDKSLRANILMNYFNWNSDDAHNIWFFLPNETEQNIIVGKFEDGSYLTEYDIQIIKEKCKDRLNTVMKNGFICGGNICNICMKMNVLLLGESYKHYSPLQSMFARGFYECFVQAMPRLL